MLTPKQEKFVQELIKGKSQIDAYKASYNAENMKDDTIYNKASLLFAKGEIRQRYNELIEKQSERALWTREQAIKDLLYIKDEAIKYGKREMSNDEGEPVVYIDNKLVKVAIDSIKELNNMHGYNEQNVKLDAETDLQVNISIVDKVKK